MIPAPNDPRDTFDLLSSLGDDGDLDALLGLVDWTGVSATQIYLGIFGRLPETAAMAVPGPGYNARDHARAALLSAEFQSTLRERLLAAYPEQRRLVFVHIPKCAGTDLTKLLDQTYPLLSPYLTEPHWTPKPLMAVRDLVRQAARGEAIFVCGHVRLRWYLAQRLCRFQDAFFTVVRHPLEIMLSQANYVLKRFFEAPRCRHPDTREWADMLGIEVFDRDMPQDRLYELALRILREQRIVAPNCLCFYLGEGTETSAAETVARCDIEITDTLRYDRWLHERWGGETIQANRSQPILSMEQLDAADLRYLQGIAADDLRLHRRIVARLDAAGTASIRGSDLFRPVGGFSAAARAAEITQSDPVCAAGS